MGFRAKPGERALHERSLVGPRGVDERPIGGISRVLEERRRVVRHDDASTLVALLRGAPVRISDLNGRALCGAESNGYQTDALLTGMLRFGDHVVHVLERLAVAHHNERFVGAAVREHE